MNQNDGESCPGSAECRETRGMPLNRYADAEEDDICRGCSLFATKPEAVPDEIAEYVSDALSLSELKRGGARFEYPDGLLPHEWAALNGMTRGTDRAETMRQARERSEATKKKRKGPITPQ